MDIVSGSSGRIYACFEEAAIRFLLRSLPSRPLAVPAISGVGSRPIGLRRLGMWWRSLALLLAGGVLGTGFGVALGFFLFPFVFPPPPAAELLADTDRRAPIVAEGTFIHANPGDPIHWG